MTWFLYLHSLILTFYRVIVGSGNPSRAQLICGVGLPAAEHFKDTAGPGWRVCSMNEYIIIGGASEKQSKNHVNQGILGIGGHMVIEQNHGCS